MNGTVPTWIWVALAITSALAAQNGNVLSVLNAEEATRTIVHPNSIGQPVNLGVVAFVNATGSLEYHVSSAGHTDPVDGRWRGTNAPPHTIFVLSEEGAFVRKYFQPTPPWPPGASFSGARLRGVRDGASDQSFIDPARADSTTFFWGNEAGLWLVDQNGALKNSYSAEAGVLAAPAVPIQGPGLVIVGTYRGVAYNPKGNRRGVPVAVGRGSWFTGSLDSALIEIDNAGNVLNLFPNTDWIIAGLAWDPITEKLWLNDSGGFIVEVDPVTGLETGRRIWTNPAQTLDRGFPGGLDIALPHRAACRTILGSGKRTGGATLVAMRQDSRLLAKTRGWDTLFTYLLDYDTDSTPASPATLTRTEHGQLEVGVNGAFQGDHATIEDSAVTADLRLTDPSGNDAAGVLHLVVNEDARGSATLPASLPGLDHVVCGWSLPASSVQTTPGGADVSVPIVPGFRVSIPTSAIPMTTDVIAAQALVINRKLFGNPGILPAYASNRVKFDPVCTSTRGLPVSIGVTVSATGPNSFNQDTATGFWQITNDSPYPILSAELAFPPHFSEGWFDTDNPNMGWLGPDLFAPRYSHFFTAGDIPFPNSLGNNGRSVRVPACAGTWRNRSAVRSGLVFGRPGEPAVHPCARQLGSSGTGFTAGASEPWRLQYDMTALNFAFGPGQFVGGVTAEWDVDTDGRGTSGAEHAGMRVDITFAGILPNGADGTWCAVLAPDPHDPTRASASR